MFYFGCSLILHEFFLQSLGRKKNEVGGGGGNVKFSAMGQLKIERSKKNNIYYKIYIIDN